MKKISLLVLANLSCG